MKTKDPWERLTVLCEKIKANGPESLTEEEQQEFKELSNALVEAIQPLVAMVAEFAQKMTEFLSDWWNSLPRMAQRQLAEMSAEQRRAGYTIGSDALAPSAALGTPALDGVDAARLGGHAVTINMGPGSITTEAMDIATGKFSPVSARAAAEALRGRS